MLIPVAMLALVAAETGNSSPNAVCMQCHPKVAELHRATGMARALSTAEHGKVLQSHAKMTFEQGPYKYTIERQGTESIFTVTDGKAELRAPISWAFGKGSAGQTYMLKRGGSWYEGRVSFYKDIDSLDLTVGARPDVPRNLEEAFGRELSNRGAFECFNCHGTKGAGETALRPDTLIAGIHCARCHQNAEEHGKSMTTRQTPKVFPAKLAPATAEEMSEFCGQCHRTWAQIAADGPHNITNVRFQPYRLTNSKCYDTSDARIACTTCHNPHATEPSPPAHYDSKCNACHQAGTGAKAGAKLCKTGNSGCTNCHMPKVEIKETHTAFTDHWIRIARPGQTPPH